MRVRCPFPFALNHSTTSLSRRRWTEVLPPGMTRLFSNKSTQSPTGFSPNPYDCRGFGDSATPKTSIRLRGDFGGPMPTGLKGHQQLWSGCEAKPSERQSRPFGSGYAAGYIELSRKRHQATWRVERSAISMGHYVPLLEFNL